jgi:hypothetical protein
MIFYLEICLYFSQFNGWADGVLRNVRAGPDQNTLLILGCLCAAYSPYSVSRPVAILVDILVGLRDLLEERWILGNCDLTLIAPLFARHAHLFAAVQKKAFVATFSGNFPLILLISLSCSGIVIREINRRVTGIEHRFHFLRRPHGALNGAFCEVSWGCARCGNSSKMSVVRSGDDRPGLCQSPLQY